MITTEEIYELVRCLDNDTIFMNEHASNLFHVQEDAISRTARVGTL